MILLDTNALIWLLTGSPRAHPLQASREGLRVSPVALLELRFLREVGRLSVLPGHQLEEIADDSRWKVDSPAAMQLFGAAFDVDWTRDPFDRLLVAHARYRGWRLATGDRSLKERLGAEAILAL